MTRLEKIVQQLDPLLPAPCHVVTVTKLVLLEYPDSSMRQEVATDLDGMIKACQDLCRNFNNLRSHTASLEIENGNQHPFFYAGQIRNTGLPVEGCNCGN
jgi:hypothetical protein